MNSEQIFKKEKNNSNDQKEEGIQIEKENGKYSNICCPVFVHFDCTQCVMVLGAYC